MKYDTAHIASTPALPYSVSITQNGWGTNLATFATEAEAVAFAEQEWRINHDHNDFTHGGDDRAEWSVHLDRHDADGDVVDGDTLWAKKADERQ